MRNPPSTNINKEAHLPNAVAKTRVFPIAAQKRNKARAIWCIKKYAKNCLKNLVNIVIYSSEN